LAERLLSRWKCPTPQQEEVLETRNAVLVTSVVNERQNVRTKAKDRPPEIRPNALAILPALRDESAANDEDICFLIDFLVRRILNEVVTRT
jgi:hypothetical protein